MYHPALIPHMRRQCGTASPASGGGTTGIIIPATTLQRIVCGWALGNRTNTVTAIVELQTGSGNPIYRLVPWVPGTVIQLAAYLSNNDNGIQLVNIGAGAAQELVWTIIYADVPFGFLEAQPNIIGPG